MIICKIIQNLINSLSLFVISLRHGRELGTDWAHTRHEQDMGTCTGGTGHGHGRAEHSMGELGTGEGHDMGRLGIGELGTVELCPNVTGTHWLFICTTYAY